MTIEYLPVGVACNLSCSYCYQDPMRDGGNISVPKNWPRAKSVLEGLNSAFTVFGGEPLLAPIDHLREVWKFGLERFGGNSVQTNGSLITPEHLRLFQEYKVSVGISVDGPGALNALRHCGTGTDAATARTLDSIQALCELGMPPSLIVTIHQGNASPGKLLILTNWLNDLARMGVRHVNFHILELEKGKEHLALEQETNIKVFLALYEWSKTAMMTAEPFGDIRRLLTERKPNVSCVWNHCDPSTTAAVQGVNPDGSRSNCGRTNKDGVNWVKAEEAGYERYLLLHRTPQEVGGCRGCTFFIFCKGQCPGTAIEGDWRNRTRDCKLWYTLFERIEREIISERRLPLSRDYGVKREIEQEYLRIWANGDSPHADSHGDTPHGDAHLDTDIVSEGGVEITILKEPPYGPS